MKCVIIGDQIFASFNSWCQNCWCTRLSFVLSPSPLPSATDLGQTQRPWPQVPIKASRAQCSPLETWILSEPKLENLDQDKKKQMHCQPWAILVSAVVPFLKTETATLTLSDNPKTRLETGSLRPFDSI